MLTWISHLIKGTKIKFFTAYGMESEVTVLRSYDNGDVIVKDSANNIFTARAHQLQNPNARKAFA
jgi:hypothetical protein